MRELKLIWEAHLNSAGEIDVTKRRDMVRKARRILGPKHLAEGWLLKPLKELPRMVPIAAEPVEGVKMLSRLETGGSDES